MPGLRLLIIAALTVHGFAHAAAKEASYPARPIRTILPNPAGGANDTVARIVTQKMTGILGQQMVVDNRGGAGGAIGAEIAARATPDGYTVLIATFATHTMVPHLQKRIAYDPLRDFVSVALFAVQYAILGKVPLSHDDCKRIRCGISSFSILRLGAIGGQACGFF